MEARTFQALATRNPNGDKQLLIVGGGVTGYWAAEPMGASPSPRVWAPGELAVVVMSAQGWHGYFGGFKAVYGDDMALAHDIALTARYLSDRRPVDFREPATADLQVLSDGLGLRLPRLLLKTGRVESYSTFPTLAEYMRANLEPKKPGPRNLQKKDNPPLQTHELPDGRQVVV